MRSCVMASDECKNNSSSDARSTFSNRHIKAP